jgi:hypothetical protein
MEVRYAPLDWRLSCGILVGVATTLAVRSIVSDELDWSEPQSGHGRQRSESRVPTTALENVYLHVVKIIEAVKGNAA